MNKHQENLAKIRRSNQQFKWVFRFFVISILGLLFVITTDWSKTPVWFKWLLGAAAIVGVVILVAWQLRSKRVAERERTQLMPYLEKVAPFPDFDPSLEPKEAEEAQARMYLVRLRAAYHLYEGERNRPLTPKERERLQKLLGIYESDYAPDLWDKAGGLLKEFLGEAKDKLDESIAVVDKELHDYFDHRASFFTRKDKIELAALTPEERTARYAGITDEIKRLQSSGASVEADHGAVDSDLAAGNMDNRKFDDFFEGEVKDQKEFFDRAAFEEAKVSYEYRNDPEERDKRLKVFRNMVLRFRAERGW